MSSVTTTGSKRALLPRLYRQLPSAMQRRLKLVLAMMVAGAVLEVVTLGAVVPFLAFVSVPDKAWAELAKFGITSIGPFQRGSDVLIPTAAAFALLAVLAAISRTIIAIQANRFVFAVGRSLAHDVLNSVLHRDYKFHLLTNTSSIISNVQEVRQIAISVLKPLLDVFTSITTGLFITIALFFISPMVATVAFVGIGTVYLVANRLLRSTVGDHGAAIARLQAARLQVVQESLGGIRDILLDNSQHILIDKFERLDRRVSDAYAGNMLAATAPRYSIEGSVMVMITVAALYFAKQPGGLTAAIPILAALALGAQRLLPLMQTGYAAAIQVKGYRDTVDNLLKVLEAPVAEEYASPPPSRALTFQNAITIEDLSFQYSEGGINILSQISIVIPKGARVGVIGQTGSGKSTLIDLLMGLLDPSDGAIRVDGVRLSASNRRAWHRAIAHVPQAIYLTDASVAENIALGERPSEIDLDRVKAAAAKAELEAVVDNMPEGYGTGVGERGIRLSGGQRQRLGIARALYKQPSLLVLDEATSALDTATESSIMAAIRNLDADLTVVMIAHRLTTLAGCDMVLRLEKGRLVEVIRDFDPATYQQPSPLLT